jgi:hypothetical protein
MNLPIPFLRTIFHIYNLHKIPYYTIRGKLKMLYISVNVVEIGKRHMFPW